MLPVKPFQFLLTGYLLLAATLTFACSAAGPNTHVGNILNVDGQAQTLTIRDATTGQPVTFAVSNKLMTRLIGLQGQVIVRYRGQDMSQLVATDISQ